VSEPIVDDDVAGTGHGASVRWWFTAASFSDRRQSNKMENANICVRAEICHGTVIAICKDL
jgi:hypothetical protein